jgi:hypothetical protein
MTFCLPRFLLILLLALTLAACGVEENDTIDPGNSAAEPSPPPEEEPGFDPTPTPPTTATPPPIGDQEPAPTPQSVSLDLNTIYAEVVESLPQGSALFDPPEGMRQGALIPVEVRVVPVTGEQIEADEEIKATLTAGMDPEVPVVVIPVRVSTVMRARLSGTAFFINPLTEEEQIRTSDQPYLRWLWEVRPEQAGEQNLTLHLSVVVNAEGLGDKAFTTTEVRPVLVSPDYLYALRRFFGTNWEWVATGLVLPLAGWLWGRVRRRGRAG